jgi:hypothetical protein
VSEEGLTAWEALKRVGGRVVDRRRYVHEEWLLLYEAVAAGRMKAVDGKGKDISELFGGPAGLYVDPWTDEAGGGGYRFENVSFSEVAEDEMSGEAQCLEMLRSAMKQQKRRDRTIGGLKTKALADFKITGRCFDDLKKRVQEEPFTNPSWNKRGFGKTS